MKKTVFAAIAAALMLTGCHSGVTVQDPAHTPALGLAEQSGVMTPPEGASHYNEVYLWAEQDCYPPDTKSILVTISNNTDSEVSLGEAFKLIRVFENGEQEAVEFKEDCGNFNALAQIVPPHDSATFLADLAAQFDLPLEEGAYLISIEGAGGNTAAFQISENAQEPERASVQLSMKTEQDVYPTDTDSIRVTVTNQGNEETHISLANFGFEQFQDGACSITPYHGVIGCETRIGGDVPAGASDVWTLYLSDFPGLRLTEGDYAVYYDGAEAKFSVRDGAADPDTDGLPAVLFYIETSQPDCEEPQQKTQVRFMTVDGVIWYGSGARPLTELAEMYENHTLAEQYRILNSSVAADSAAEQYRRIKTESLMQRAEINRAEAEPAVEASRTHWYALIPQTDGTYSYYPMGEEFCGSFYDTDNKNVNAVCAWLKSVMKAE